MAIRWETASQALLNAVLLLLGMILAAVPLALWMVWSEILFVAVVAVFCIALPLYIALSWFERPSAGGPAAPRPTIDTDFIDEAQRLHPWVHHHFRHGTTQFNGAMAKLRGLIRLK